jgi:hypothetical protein
MSVVPLTGSDVQLTLTGYLKTPEQYKDLMLALLRIPKAANVSRSGFQTSGQYVPALTPDDQTGRPIKAGEQPVPDDPIRRLEYYQAQGSISGYTGVGGFGQGPETTARGAMPDYSTVTVTVTFPFEYPSKNPVYKGLQAPDPSATLRSAGGAPAAVPAAGPGAGFAPPAGAAGPAAGAGRGAGATDREE